jgi:hypothetical protein
MAVTGIGGLFVPATTRLDDTPKGVPFYPAFATVHPSFPAIRRKTLDPGHSIGYDWNARPFLNLPTLAVQWRKRCTGWLEMQVRSGCLYVWLP